MRWKSWGDPFDMDDAAGFFALVVSSVLLAVLAHWIWFEPALSIGGALRGLWTGAGTLLLVLVLPVALLAVGVVAWALVTELPRRRK